MILESLATTISAAGEINLAPLGPIVHAGDEHDASPEFTLRPYEGSTTCENLLSTGAATIHVSDDVLLLTRAALGSIRADELVCPVEGLHGSHVRLRRCHRFFAVKVTEKGGKPPRHALRAQTIASEIVGPFFGFNRAKHAVIELAVLATRIGLVEDDFIVDQVQQLRTTVEKTAGPAEREAFDLIVGSLRQRIGANITPLGTSTTPATP